MKTRKLLTVLLATLMVFTMFTACAVESNEISVTLTIVAHDAEGEEDVIFDGIVKVDDPAPTVLMAVLEANGASGLDVTLKNEDKSVKSIKTYDEVTVDGISYYWDYTKNGIVPDAKSGKAGDDLIVEGDVIRYEYLTYDMNAAQ